MLQIGPDGFQYRFCHSQLSRKCHFSTQSPPVWVESQKYLHFSTTMHLYLGQRQSDTNLQLYDGIHVKIQTCS